MTTKVCTKCNEEKENAEFPFRTDRQKYRTWCKICEVERVRKYTSENKELVKVSQAAKYQKHKEKYHATQKEWIQKNLERHREYRRVYMGDRYKNDINFRLANALRSRVRGAFKSGGGKKTVLTMDLIGCTIEELWIHLESRFTEGMTRENYGRPTEGPGWEIDHIRPCISFNLEDPEEQKKCFHWTNLQPLWAIDNMKKGAKWDDDEVPDYEDD
jgi:hypothetical protein